jgi:hypothetical protein
VREVAHVDLFLMKAEKRENTMTVEPSRARSTPVQTAQIFLLKSM